MIRRTSLGPAVFLLAAACAGNPEHSEPRPVDPPRRGVRNAYEYADEVQLRAVAPIDHVDLHNVFQLSDDIISGSEPHSEAAFERIAARGVRTILSVDGKIPDADAAERHGMRYVHIPIHYNGISPEELSRIAKTFRELPGPFYVHCFHGRHRGPAAAAVGRLVLDGVSREQVLAEMRQWCGTSEKYEGLYQTLATGEIPSAETTVALEFDFSPEHSVAGLRGAMIGLARAYDHLQDLAERNWQMDPAHPDIDAGNEADKLHELFAESANLDKAAASPEDFRSWLDTSVQASRELRDALADLAHDGVDAGQRADAALGRVAESCSACHEHYRNH